MPNDERNPVGALYPSVSGNGCCSGLCTVNLIPAASVVGR